MPCLCRHDQRVRFPGGQEPAELIGSGRNKPVTAACRCAGARTEHQLSSCALASSRTAGGLENGLAERSPDSTIHRVQFAVDDVGPYTVAKHDGALVPQLTLKIPFGCVRPDRRCIAGLAGNECQPARGREWDDLGIHWRTCAPKKRAYAFSRGRALFVNVVGKDWSMAPDSHGCAAALRVAHPSGSRCPILYFGFAVCDFSRRDLQPAGKQARFLSAPSCDGRKLRDCIDFTG